MKTIVGIDIETTALDPEKGEIIEVAAVRYPFSKLKRDRSEVERGIETFVRLCKPGRVIGEETTILTGITNEMVAGAPRFSDVLEELQEFIGEDILFAHNASFDMKWLRYHGLSLGNNKVIDTFMVASVAWPEAESYNLSALNQELGIKNQEFGGRGEPRKIPLMAGSRGEHSAEYDVEMAWQVLQAARERLVASPVTYKRIMELLERTGLAHYGPLFTRTPLLDKERSPRQSGAGEVPTDGALYTSPSPSPKLGEGNARAILGPNGPLAATWEGFVPRAEQQQMAEHIEVTLREGGISLIEAPTGIGKTVAYLTPLLMQFRESNPTSPSPLRQGSAGRGLPDFAKASPGRRGVLSSTSSTESKAIISTYTKHLQDQLITEDVPRLQRSLGTACRVATLKGRRNYVCIRRLGLALEKLIIRQPDAWILIKILLWLEKDLSAQSDPTSHDLPAGRQGFGATGDLDRLNLMHQEEGILAALNADSLVCKRTCGRLNDSPCPYQHAWRAAEAAQILVVNHALLAELSHINRWTIKAVVVDEAHHIEDALRRATRVPLQLTYLQDIMSPLLSKAAQEADSLRHIRIEAKEIIEEYAALLGALGECVSADKETVRLTPSIRRSSRWGVIEKKRELWLARCTFLIGLLEGSAASLAELFSQVELDDIVARLGLFSRTVDTFIKGDLNRIQWVDRDFKGLLHVHDVALSVGPLLQRLYGSVPAVIFASATLTTQGNFRYIQSILGISSPRELVLPSSFPLKENMLIYLVDDAPQPSPRLRRASRPGVSTYEDYIAHQLEILARLFGGRTLGLFTSYASIKTVFHLLNRTLNKANIRLYAQGQSGGRSNMLRRFRQEPRSVLLGTDSFWEGVDIPGDTLSCVVIPKLPFSPPHDPVTEALSDSLQVDSFETMSLPQMILKLRQGIGRLIRRADDRGVVVIFDPRLHRSRYGAGVISSLPAGRIKIGSAADLSRVVRDWMGEDVLERWNLE